MTQDSQNFLAAFGGPFDLLLPQRFPVKQYFFSGPISIDQKHKMFVRVPESPLYNAVLEQKYSNVNRSTIDY